MAAIDATQARIGITLDKYGFGMLTINGVMVAATGFTLEAKTGEKPQLVIRVPADEVRALIERADLKIVTPDAEPVELVELPDGATTHVAKL